MLADAKPIDRQCDMKTGRVMLARRSCSNATEHFLPQAGMAKRAGDYQVCAARVRLRLQLAGNVVASYVFDADGIDGCAVSP